MSRSIGKSFQQFQQMIMQSKQGKTFIWLSKDMVAVDRKTWDKIQSELQPKSNIKSQIYHDEYSGITPELRKMLDKLPEVHSLIRGNYND